MSNPTLRRYYKPLLWLAAFTAVAPLVNSPLDWWRACEIATSVVIIGLLVEFAYYYRSRIAHDEATVVSRIWIIYLLVASYAMLLAAATIQVYDFLAADEPFRPLIALVTVPQITSLVWLIAIVGQMERENYDRA